MDANTRKITGVALLAIVSLTTGVATGYYLTISELEATQTQLDQCQEEILVLDKSIYLIAQHSQHYIEISFAEIQRLREENTALRSLLNVTETGYVWPETGPYIWRHYVAPPKEVNV